MSNYNVGLFGNLVVDNIVDQGKRLGGIANIARHLEHPYFMDYCLGEADIHINREGQSFSSDVKWNNKEWKPNMSIMPYWSHFSYLNTLNIDEQDILDANGILSTDLCSISQHGIGNARRLAGHFHYVFMSADEALSFFGGSSDNVAQIATFVHDEKGSYIYDFDGVWRMDFSVINRPINTLGAGDALVAYFINNRINGYAIRDALWRAHAQTFEFLNTRND